MSHPFQSEFEADAKHHATIALVISGLLLGLSMASIQYLLFRIRYFTSKTRLTSNELSCLVAAFWVVHYVIDEIVSTMVDSYTCFLEPHVFINYYGDFRATTYTLKGVMGWGTLSLLIHEIAGTWLLFQFLTFIFNTVVPIIVNLLRDRRVVVALLKDQFHTRLAELADYANDFEQRRGWKFRVGRGTWSVGPLKYVRRYFDIANFERNYVMGLANGERSLTWNFTLGQYALDEMKEVFGIIGVVGELGFTVSGNQVAFAAMGHGATVNIVFELEEDRLESIHEEERMKSA